MKIAVESNDGETIKSPFADTKGYIIYDVTEDSTLKTSYSKVGKKTSSKKTNPLHQCSTIITRGMDKKNIEQLKNNGIDIFVTFKTSAESALSSYMKERLINLPLLNENHH